jgi:hypothetical protein
MKSNRNFRTAFLGVLLLISGFPLAACDYFFEDPRNILYRPETIVIKDSAGQTLSRLPLRVDPGLKNADAGKIGENFGQMDGQWGSGPETVGLTEFFNPQEVPYLGGDNCLNSLFFDQLGIPYRKESDLSYRSKDFTRQLQVYVKEPSSYFFYNNKMFLAETSFPHLNRDNATVIGNLVVKQGANEALDLYYRERLKQYRDLFSGEVHTFQVFCEYPPQSLGRGREEVTLHQMETPASLVFLADRNIHMIMRKDDSLRYISDFSFSKAFFREELHFR